SPAARSRSFWESMVHLGERNKGIPRKGPLGNAQQRGRGERSGRALDLGRRHGDAVSFVEDLVAADGQAVYADEVSRPLFARQALLEDRGHRGALGNLDVVGETAAVVVDPQDTHHTLLRKRGRGWIIAASRAEPACGPVSPFGYAGSALKRKKNRGAFWN